MEKDFTPDNFALMQQQAIRRVKEMQQRSKDREKNEQIAFQSDKKSPEQSGAPSPKPPRLQMKNGNTDPKSMLSSLFRMDSDAALILPILLLLAREGAEDMLLLALLYIMSS